MRYDKPVELDVSRPDFFEIPPGTQRVWFVNRCDETADEAKIRSSILKIPERMSVDGVSLRWGCKLKTPAVASLFPAVRDVDLENPVLESLDGLDLLPKLSSLCIDVETRRRSLKDLPRLPMAQLILRVTKPQDVDFISQCEQVRSLSILAFPFADLSSLAPMTLRTLDLNRGAALSLSGLSQRPLKHVHLCAAAKLRDFGDLRAESLRVNGCNGIDLETIDAAGTLRSLWLLGQREVRSFRFLRRCRALTHLDVSSFTARTKITASDWSEIIECPSLWFIWLAFAPDSVIQMIARARPDVAVSNSKICFFEGTAVAGDHFARLTTASAASPSK